MERDYEKYEWLRQGVSFGKFIAAETGLSQAAVERLMTLHPLDLRDVRRLISKLIEKKNQTVTEAAGAGPAVRRIRDG